MIVPALRVGMPLGTLRVPPFVTQSVTAYVPTQSVGTIILAPSGEHQSVTPVGYISSCTRLRDERVQKRDIFS